MSGVRTVAVVTGTRAEYGLLRPVIHAIDAHPDLALQVLVTGTHLLPPAETAREVEAEWPDAVRLPMQTPGDEGRAADAIATGAGVSAVARWLADHPVDFVLVLGDRIEAFAAAAAATVSGIRVVHLHGGDRAEGVTDDSLRHAITKLAHVHAPASEISAHRIIAMGEDAHRVHVVGSPALDDLDAFPPLDEARFTELGAPRIVFLLHPIGRTDDQERDVARRVLTLCRELGPTFALHPNFDPGRTGIVEAIEAAGVPAVAHLERREFIGLLRRAPLLVGNSSAGLIEATALGVRCVNIGRRQAGRERGEGVIDIPDTNDDLLRQAIEDALTPVEPRRTPVHPYGDGHAGQRVAALLATLDLDAHGLRKRNTY